MAAQTEGGVEVQPPLVGHEPLQRFREEDGLVRVAAFFQDHISRLFPIFLYAGAIVDLS